LPKADAGTPGTESPGDAVTRIFTGILGRLDNLEKNGGGGGSKTIRVKVVTPDDVDTRDLPDAYVHKQFADFLLFLSNGRNVWARGGGGTGKSEMAKQAATALGRDFHATSKATHETVFSGYVQPHNGELLRTPFLDAYEHGGVFLLDDADRSDPQALAWLHMALSNGVCATPTGLIKKHADFVCVLSANTTGHGADDGYAAAMVQDIAFLNRFARMHIDYDRDLERDVVTAKYGDDGVQWAEYCWAVRDAAEKENATSDVLVTLRTILDGAHMLAAGMARTKVENAYLWDGVEQHVVRRVKETAKREGE